MDTDVGECTICELEGDCIEGVCSNCAANREEAEQMAKDEFCDGCKGQYTMLHHDSACTETCDAFKEDVKETLRQWAVE